eukprot:GABW01003327.1.p2 GENE.GABW01003327.1~~GABW01003327.1.p2  ORF type:complete len:102 (-),score=18.42 GABW01003327.1:3-308(-)
MYMVVEGMSYEVMLDLPYNSSVVIGGGVVAPKTWSGSELVQLAFIADGDYMTTAMGIPSDAQWVGVATVNATLYAAPVVTNIQATSIDHVVPDTIRIAHST